MKQKTYKREIAILMLAFYFASLFVSLWEPEAFRLAESAKYPVFTFAAGAFALDAAFKQGK